MTLEDLQNKKIVIVGMGVNNRGMAEYFKSHGIAFDVIESWTSPDNLIGRFDSYDVIFRSPGLPYLSSPVQQAKAMGVEISSQTKLFFDLCPAEIIGVTGTKGKGTTSSLITKILQDAGKKVFLGGNIGRDPFEFLDQLQPHDEVVLELSSFQLQDMDKSPHIAVVLNISPDHLNYHKTMDEYLQAKSQILAFQKSTDYAILHPALPDWIKKLCQAKKIFFDPEKYLTWPTKLLGRHNLDNIAAAASVAELLGISAEQTKSTVATFEPLPHRLNIRGTYKGITYIDDAFSTNVEPTIAAIEAIHNNIILIVGGFDKGLDFTHLVEKINQTKNVKAAVVIGEVTGKIAPKLKCKTLTGAKTMEEMMLLAQSIAVSDDVILFSPATSSFDLFINEADRGEQFVESVNALK